MFAANLTTVSDNLTSLFEGPVNVTEPIGTVQKKLIDYVVFRAGLWLFRNGWKIVAPPGIIGNLITVIVTLKMKPFNSTSLFMISLAIVDLFVICWRIPFQVVSKTTTTMCRVLWYLYNALPLFSNYILLFWTIERFIAVQFPLRVMEWCTVKRTGVTIVVAGIFSFAMNIAWPVSLILSPNGRGCKILSDKIEFIYEIWYKVDSSFFFFIPMIIIFFCNITIIYRLQQSTKRHQRMTSNEESKQKREKEQRNTTITLLSVSFAFLILHTPLAIYNCRAMTAISTTDIEVMATWEFLNFLGLSLMEFQNSVNFYLYFLTGRRYRQIIISLIVPCRNASVSRSKGLESTTKMTGVSTISNGT